MPQSARQPHPCVASAGVFAPLLWEAVLLKIDRVKPSHRLEILKMIDWVPVVFVAFKVLIFGACAFFSIKWHYDQGKKTMDKRALLRTGGKVAAVFTLALVVLLLLTFGLASTLGMDLRLP